MEKERSKPTSERMIFGSLIVAPVFLFLSACEPTLTGGGESAAVNRLAAQGFVLVSDGRENNQATAMSYSGAPDDVIVCARAGSTYSKIDKLRSIRTTDGLVGKEIAQVDAYVIIDNNGQKRGVYSSTIVREIRTRSGRLLGREIENIDFRPGATGKFQNGLACRAAS